MIIKLTGEGDPAVKGQIKHEISFPYLQSHSHILKNGAPLEHDDGQGFKDSTVQSLVGILSYKYLSYTFSALEMRDKLDWSWCICVPRGW